MPVRVGFRLRAAEGVGVAYLRGVVDDAAAGEPFAQAAFEEVVGKVQAPQGAVFNAGFGEGAVEVEHADEAGPLPRPVGKGEDGTAV